jgi:curved DNA-binding protein CbpA
MASSVKARPNHYEVLGLSPTASQDEISQAFAKEMGMFGARPVTAAAQIGLAFEVLRDPVKRQAYDSSLGLTPKPEQRPWTMAEQERGATGFIGWGSTAAADRVTFDDLPRRIAEPEPRSQAEPTPEQRLASIAASLRELADRDVSKVPPETDIRPAPERQPRAEMQPRPEMRSEAKLDLKPLLTTDRPQKEGLRVAEHHPADWRRPAIAVGALVAVAGLAGALGGISVKNTEDQVTVPLPSPKPQPAITAPAPATVAVAPETQNERPLRPEIQAAQTRRIASPQRLTPAVEQQVEDQTVENPPVESQPGVAASDPLAPEPQTAQPIPASLPLPNAVIARTIERIGYACGEVSSAVAIEGAAPGTFKVTCSSGHTYQAKPVHGRYRFKRWGGQ